MLSPLHHPGPALPPGRLRPLAHAVRQALPLASVSVWASPMESRPVLQLPVQPGCTIASTMPAALADQVVVCRYQGEWILRADWQRPVRPGDLVEWHVRPQGGNGGSDPLRTILQIVILIAIIEFAPYLTGEWGIFAGANTAAVTAGLQIGANLALNALLPVSQQQLAGASGPQASPSYSVALSGNAARLDGAIPVLYGFNRTFPDFAGQPYTTYDGTTSDQFYHALLSLGHGTYTVPRIEIDDTPLSAFADVEFNILPPGTAPTLVSPAVVTAPEVTGQELTPGRYVGAFAASGPTLVASAMAFDVALGGLGVVANDGGISSKTVTVRFEARPVDDWGAATGAWAVLGTEDITAATADAVRRSYSYTLSTPGRYLARAVRTSAKDESRQVLNTVAWVGLRATLTAPAPLEPSVTHIEIRMRASEQLNGLSQRKISVTSLRKLPTWTPSAPGSSTGTWGALTETRNPAWAIADKLRNAVYGDGLADSQIDLAGLYALAQTWDARQDRCDLVFDTFTDSASAEQALAGSGRAVVVRRNGVRTVVRDEVAELPTTAFPDRRLHGFPARAIREGSWSQAYGLPTSDSADGYIIEYWSNRAWDWLSIECPAPGRTYTDTANPGYNAALPMMSRPIRERLLGVTGQTHAKREGAYKAAKLVYRRRIASWSTELQGILPAFGSAVKLAPALDTWARSGDVVSWNAGTLSMGLTEPHAIASGTHYISLQRDDGTWTPSIVVTAGADDYTVTLASAPGFDLVLDAADRERPKYILGTATVHARIGRMLSIEPAGTDDQGTPVINMTAVIEDDRVHTADEALLPTGATVQDAINLDPIEAEPGGGGGDGGGSTLLLTSLTGLTLNEPSVGSALARYELLANGQVRQTTYPSGSAVRGSEWLIIAPTTTTDTSLFEARATVTAGALTAGTAGTWQALGTTSLWEVANTTADSTLTATLTIELRAIAAAGTILQSVTVVLIAQVLPEPGG